MIALFRHLPTTHDTHQLYTDWNENPPLAELPPDRISGIREEMIAFIKRFAVQGIYVSDNPRGRATINTIFPVMLDFPQIHMDVRLNNIKQPEWSGKSQAEVAHLPLYRQWHTAPLTVHFPNGECLLDVVERMNSFFRDVQHRPVIIFSHTTPMQVALCRVLGIDVDKIWSFKFDHLAFTLLYKNVLLRYNSERIADIELNDLRKPNA